MAKGVSSKRAADPSALLAKALETLDRDKAVARSALGPPAVREGLVRELCRRGYELGARFVRVALEAQLEAALRERSYLALKTLGAHVRGATATEARAAAVAFAKAGRAHVVLRTRSEVLVALGDDIVGSDELEGAAARAAELAKVLQTASKKKLSVLRSDAKDLLERIFEARSASTATRDVGPRKSDRADVSGRTSTFDGSASRGVLSRVIGAVNEAMDPSGLAFVPKVVNAVAPDVDRETAKAALLDAASQGLLELRPETGLGRLSEAELLSCPEGAQGARLSWARRTKESA